MDAFQKHFKVTFQSPELLRLALTHRSYLSVSGKGPRESNERLEFLGDSVLGLVTSEYLYRIHPTEHEGQLTKTKSLLVSKAILSRRALEMGLGRFVFMSHSEVESGGRQRLSILADAFESVLGAIYLDQGFEASREFIHKWLLSEAREIAADKRHTNYKSHLQEYVQSNFRTHPVYRIRSEMGPDHSKQFMVDVMVGRRSMGTGRGRNKKEAEQAAARDALERVTGGVEEAAVEAPRTARPEPEPTIVPRVEADDLDLDEGPSRRRGRRGGRRRSGGDERPVEAHPDDERPLVEPPAKRPPLRETEPPARRAPIRESEPPVIRVPSYMASRLSSEGPSELETREIEPPPERFEEDEEEIGRPEGPLEERHVDPFAIEETPEALETSSGPGSSRSSSEGPAPSFGRSVVGPIRSGMESGVRESEESDDRGPEPSPPPRPERADRPQGPKPFGRRPGRSRR